MSGTLTQPDLVLVYKHAMCVCVNIKKGAPPDVQLNDY